MRYIEWFSLTAGSTDEGVPIDLEKEGIPSRWEGFFSSAKKPKKGGSKAPLWAMDRFAAHLCRNGTYAAIGARRVVIPWEGELDEKEFGWEC